MREEVDPPEAAVAEIAAVQHGVVTTAQLQRAGLVKGAVSRRVRAGSLHRLYRGVYAVGHRGLSQEGRWLAAVLAHGDDAVLSHRSAAELWELVPPTRGLIDVTVTSRSGRRGRPGIELHRPRALASTELTRLRNIPVTNPARTLTDLRRVVPSWRWRRALRQAEFRRLPLGTGLETDRTRSDLERDFLRLCRRWGLPAPEVNVRIDRWTVDFLWRRERIAVETDFYDYHRGRIAFQDDRARDLGLRRLGFAVHRFSELQLNEQPARVAEDLKEALDRARVGITSVVN